MARLCLALPIVVLALAGCGGDDKKKTASGPQETLGAVAGALRDAESFHIEGTQTNREGETRLEGDVTDGAIRVSMLHDGGSAEMIVIGSDDVYIRANAAFWEESEAPAQVRELLADRWAKIPADDEVTEVADHLQPAVLADCLDDDVGTLSIREDTLDGEPVVVFADKGDKPGTAPGELYVSATDPQLPLRIRQTGPSKPGGPPPDPKCSTDDDDDEDDGGPTIRGDMRFSRWDEPVEIEAPEGALDLEELARQAQGRSTV